MKRTVLKVAPEICSARLKKKTSLCIALAVLAAAIHLALYVFVTDRTHGVFLAASVALDVLVGGFLFADCSIKILPERRRYRFFLEAQHMGSVLEGTVKAIETAERAGSFDCVKVRLRTQGSERVVYVIADTFEQMLSSETRVRLRVWQNIASECEVLR